MSSNVQDLTDSLIDGLYKQAQSERKKKKPDNYVTERKKVINAHIPGN